MVVGRSAPNFHSPRHPDTDHVPSCTPAPALPQGHATTTWMTSHTSISCRRRWFSAHDLSESSTGQKYHIERNRAYRSRDYADEWIDENEPVRPSRYYADNRPVSRGFSVRIRGGALSPFINTRRRSRGKTRGNNMSGPDYRIVLWTLLGILFLIGAVKELVDQLHTKNTAAPRQVDHTPATRSIVIVPASTICI